MRTQITNIGNSKGIIIPKAIIEQCGLKERVNLEVKDNCLVISTKTDNPRQEWEAAIITAGVSDNDELLTGDYLEHSWDESEWTWCKIGVRLTVILNLFFHSSKSTYVKAYF